MAHRSIRRLLTAFSGAALALAVPWLMASAMTVAAADGAAADGAESPGPDWTVPVPDLGSLQASSPMAVLARDGALAAITAHQVVDTVWVQGFDARGDVAWRRELSLADADRVELRACGSDRTCLLSDVGGAWLEDADGTIVASLPPARDVVTGDEGGLLLLQFDHDCVPSASCPHRGARIDISADGDVVAEHLFEGAPLAMSPGGAVVVHDDGTTFLLDVDGGRLPYAEDAIPGLTWFRHRFNLTGWGHSGLVDDEGRFIGLRGGCPNFSPFPCNTHDVIAMDRDGLLWSADTAVPGHSRISHWELQRIADADDGADADILVAIHHTSRDAPAGAPVRDDRLNLLRLAAGGQIVWQRNLLSAGMGASRLFQLPGQQSLALVRPGDDDGSLVLTVLDAASGQLHGEQAVACPAGHCQSWWFDVGAGGSGHDGAEPALMALAQADDSAWLMRQAGAGQFQAVPGIALAQGGLSGAWYAPRSAGQGFALQLLPGADGTHVFMPWFTFHGGYIYPDVEALRWYVLEGLVDPDDTDARLTVWQVTGGRFLEPGGERVRVGSARLWFPGCSQALLDYDLDDLFADQASPGYPLPMGPDGVIALHPLLPAGGPCEDGGSDSDDDGHDEGDAAAPMLRDPYLSGVWYDPDTIGQGLVIQHLLAIADDGEIEQFPDSADLVFGTWYSHDNAEPAGWPGDQHWFTFQSMPDAGPEDAHGIHAVIHQTIGGRLDGPATGDHYRVGEVELLPQSCRELVLRWRFDDRPEAGQFRNLEGEIQLFRLGDCEYPLD